MTSFSAPAETTGPDAPTPDQGAPQAPQAPSNPAPRPEWLPEKFATPEDMARSYAELEGRLSSQDKAPAVDPSTASRDDVAATLQSSGMDINTFYSEYEQNGSLSQESYEKLAAAGLDQKFVDAYIEGQNALAERVTNEIYASVGGEEQFQAMSAWAMQNLSQGELNAYSRAIDNGDLEVVKVMLSGIHAKYVAANGKEPALTNGRTPNQPQGFQSMQQMVAAMKDPRYGVDPAYEKWLDGMIANSNF